MCSNTRWSQLPKRIVLEHVRGIKAGLEISHRDERHEPAAEPKRFTAKLAKRSKADDAGGCRLGVWARSIAASRVASLSDPPNSKRVLFACLAHQRRGRWNRRSNCTIRAEEGKRQPRVVSESPWESGLFRCDQESSRAERPSAARRTARRTESERGVPSMVWSGWIPSRATPQRHMDVRYRANM